MAQKITASMPLDLDLGATWIVQFSALDPVTGDDVSGVNFSDVSLHVAQVAPSPGGPTALAVAPLWVPVALEGE